MKKYYEEKEDKKDPPTKIASAVVMLFNPQSNFLFYTFVHIVSAFAVQTVVSLFFSTEKRDVLNSSIIGLLLISTVITVRREKMKPFYALAANICFFLAWTMYFFVLVSGLSLFLFDVQL